MKNLLASWSKYENGWTGGQYSVFRFIFGSYLFCHFLALVPWGAELWSNQGALADGAASPLLKLFPNMFLLADSPGFVTGVMVVATGLAAMLAAGWHDRLAALGLWYIWACLFGRDPFISNPGLPYVGLLLLVHAILPSGAWGSFARRPNGDPGHKWSLPQSLFFVVWMLMAVGYTYSGYEKLCSPSWVSGEAMERVLMNPLARTNFLVDAALSLPKPALHLWTWGALAMEILFLPLALWSRSRPLIWFALLGMHFGIISMVNFADLSLGMVMLHLFTFDPKWVKPRAATGVDRVYYDGSCGLCHGAVTFLLSEDRQANFKYSPLDSDSFRSKVAGAGNNDLPDSMVVLTSEGIVLTKSAAWMYLMSRLGGLWRVVSWGAHLVPTFLRDAAYDLVAAYRKQLVKPAETACPLLPVELRGRFEY